MLSSIETRWVAGCYYPEYEELGKYEIQAAIERPRAFEAYSFVFSWQSKKTAHKVGFRSIMSHSTAANADVIIHASIDHAVSSGQKVGIWRKIRGHLQALVMQYYEQFLLKKNPDAGEEVVLRCIKE